MMKRLTALALICGALAGCGGDDKTVAHGGKESAEDTPRRPKLTDDALEKLKDTQVEGFELVKSRLDGFTGLKQTYKKNDLTSGDATLFVELTVSSAVPRECVSLDPTDHKDRGEERRKMLPGAKYDDQEFVWTAESIQFSEAHVGLITHLQFFAKTDKMTERVHSYESWYHDGVNGVKLKTFAHANGTVDSMDRVGEMMPAAEAERAMQTVFESYASVFE